MKIGQSGSVTARRRDRTTKIIIWIKNSIFVRLIEAKERVLFHLFPIEPFKSTKKTQTITCSSSKKHYKSKDWNLLNAKRQI